MGALLACLVLAISAVAAVDFTEFVDTKIAAVHPKTCRFELKHSSKTNKEE